MKTLFKNADILLTKENGFEVLKNGFLGIDGSRIDYIDSDRPETAYDTERDFNGKLLMPGLINTHTHSPMTLLRGLGNDLPLQEWLFDKIMPVEDQLTPDDIRLGSEMAILEMISTGTTSFCDMYFENEQTIGACLEAGIKANISRPLQSFDPNETYEQNVRAAQSIELFKARNGAGDGRILIDLSIHAEYTNRSDQVRRFSEDCKALGARMHIHLSETRREHVECIEQYGKTPAAWFNDLGVFENPTYAAHCVWVTEDDIGIMAEKGVSVMNNPSSNMKLGSGFLPLGKMKRAGLNITIGTDGTASNNNLNMFEEMHLAALIYKGFALDATVNSAADVLMMATRNGAKLQGRSDTGELKVGNKADIIALDMNKPHLIPNPDTIGMLCYSAQGSDVCMTMVDGKVLYENGQFLTMDVDRITAGVKSFYKRIGLD